MRVHHAQFEELGVIDRRRLHSAAWGRVRSAVGSGGGSPLSPAGFRISSGSDEPLDILAPSGRATQEKMPAATRQQADEEERAATAVALEEARGQAEQASAAEQLARDAL